MIRTWCYDVECLRNFFSVTAVSMESYLEMFKDCVDERNKPVPLVKNLSTAEIERRLDKVSKVQLCVSDIDSVSNSVDSSGQINCILSFFESLLPHYQNDGTPLRNDLFGYNSERYDRLMIAAFMMYARQYDNVSEFLARLYDTSRHIVSIGKGGDKKGKDPVVEPLRNYRLPYTNVDLMTLFALNKCGKGSGTDGKMIYFPKSLKQTSINLQWYQLMDYQMPAVMDGDELNRYYAECPSLRGVSADEITRRTSEWDRFVMPYHIPDMMVYNANDVYICCEMIRLYIDEIRLRYNLSASYKMNVLSSSRSNCGDKLFARLYSKFSGLKESEWKDLKTHRRALAFNKVILPTISFKTDGLISLLNDMKRTVVYEMKKDSFSRNVVIGKMTYTVATGGVHTKDEPRRLVSDVKTKDGSPIGKELDWDNLTEDSYVYVHQDVTSFYPSLIIGYGICPAHMSQKAFVSLVKYLKDTRVRAKHSKEKTIDGIDAKLMAESLKITINAIYGKFNYAFGPLYDRLAALKVTINGQLMLLMLCERLEMAGIEVVSANTDGIVVKLYKSRKKEFDSIVNEWQIETKMDSDSEEYRIYINRDINNYISQEFSGKFTLKGVMNPMMYAINLQKGYDMPIVATAVLNYFVYDKPVMETFRDCTNILEFCKTQNVSLKYVMEIHSGAKKFKAPKNVRFYASNRGVRLYKTMYSDNGKDVVRQENLCRGQNITVLNRLDDKDMSDRDIDYTYYYRRAIEIIDSIVLGRDVKNVKRNKMSESYKTLFDDVEQGN